MAARAYTYALPAVVMYKARSDAFHGQNAGGRRQPNKFVHRHRLADHTSRRVTSPNSDTLYSSAWLDLSGGPLLLNVPDAGNRYFSLQFMDFFTNSFAYVSRRAGNLSHRQFLIAGPGHNTIGQSGIPVIHAPTYAVWIICRILVDGPNDLKVVHALQDGLILAPLNGKADISIPSESPDPFLDLNFFSVANAALKENPPPADEENLLADFAKIGVGPNQTFDSTRFDERQRTILRALPADFRRSVRQGRGANRAAWRRPNAHLGNYGKRYRLRATVALVGLGANTLQEAMYFRATGDANGESLYGRNRYVLTFRPDELPAVEAFWSISMYRVDPDLRSFFVENPLGRYSIGDRTKGLKFEPDGSLKIYIQRASPGRNRESNWLPAPDGHFRLTLRAYHPKAALLSGAQTFPPLQRQ